MDRIRAFYSRMFNDEQEFYEELNQLSAEALRHTQGASPEFLELHMVQNVCYSRLKGASLTAEEANSLIPLLESAARRSYLGYLLGTVLLIEIRDVDIPTKISQLVTLRTYLEWLAGYLDTPPAEQELAAQVLAIFRLPPA